MPPHSETPLTALSGVRKEALIGLLVVVLSAVYLLPFVARGWISHDEGMLGQVAVRVLQGQRPHVDFEDPYTGGLAMAYAALFGWFGVELLYIRWLLFAGAVVATAVMFRLFRRSVGPWGAAAAAGLGVLWSFPNYFAGLPSWWLLVASLICGWAMVRYLESAQLRFLCLSGISATLAITVKQTGIFLLVAVAMVAVFSADVLTANRRMNRAVRLGCAGLGAAVAFVVFRRGASLAEIVYLLVPLSACIITLATDFERGPQSRLSLSGVAWATAIASLPLIAFVAPYLLDGHLHDFVYGAFVRPQARLAFARLPMGTVELIVLGVPIIWLMVSRRVWLVLPASATSAALWVTSVGLAIAATRTPAAYHVLWQSTRAAAALLPTYLCWQLRSVKNEDRRNLMYLSACLLAWMSLNQFPYAAPIYFCYVAPLAVFAATVASRADGSLSPALAPWAAGLALFAVLSLNTGYLDSLGIRHRPYRLWTPLELPMAHVEVSPTAATTFRSVTRLVEEHLGTGDLVAVPDCPEVYFLAARYSRTGRLYDFFDGSAERRMTALDEERWRQASVFVINHEPAFSPSLSEELLKTIRNEFQHGARVGQFEVRWRS